MNELKRCLHINPNFFQMSPNPTRNKRHKIEESVLAFPMSQSVQATGFAGARGGVWWLHSLTQSKGHASSLRHRCCSGASELSLSMFRPNASDSSLAGVHAREEILILKAFFSPLLPQVFGGQSRLQANSGLANTASLRHCAANQSWRDAPERR